MNTKLIKILDEFFSLGGNHNKIKLIDVRNNLINFLRLEEIILGEVDDKNFIIARDAIRVIDALIHYAETNDRITANRHVQPFLERLIEIEQFEWSYSELKFLVIAIDYAENIEQAVTLADMAFHWFKYFGQSQNVDALLAVFATNFCSWLLYDKYCGERATERSRTQFREWYLRLEKLFMADSQFELLYLVTRIRRAIYENYDREMILQYYNELTERYDISITDLVKHEINATFVAGVVERLFPSA